MRTATSTRSRLVGGAPRVRKPTFYLVTAAFLAFLLFAMAQTAMMVVNAWLPAWEFPIHRVHHVMIGGSVLVLILAIASQLYRPTKRVGALMVAIVLLATLTAASVVESGFGAIAELAIFLVPAALIAVLHPRRKALIRSFSAAPDRGTLLVGLVGLIAFGALAIGELTAAVTLTDEHVAFGHYGFMAGALAAIGIWAVLGAFKPTGWRALIYAAGGLALLFAAVSLAFPGAEQGSALWIAAAVVVALWAVALVIVAERDEQLRTVTNRFGRQSKPT